MEKRKEITMKTVLQSKDQFESLVGKRVRLELVGLRQRTFCGVLERRESELYPYCIADERGQHVILHRSLRVAELTSA